MAGTRQPLPFWRKVRYRIEYAFCVPLLAIVRAAPVGFSCKVAAILGDLAYAVLYRRRRLAVENILRAGIAATPKEARRIARASFRHLARVVAESFHASEITLESIPDHFDLDLPPATRDIFRDPKRGFILYSGHLGNWEVAAAVISLFHPLTGIQRPMDNPYVQRLLERTKMRGAFSTVDKHEANPHQLVNALRAGHALAILADQHASGNSLRIDFFGRPASTYVTPALLHLLTRVPIVVGFCLDTERPLHYRLFCREPLGFERSGDRAADLERITRILTKALEDAIRDCPEQYLWAHRRWRKTKSPATS